jgi:endonuclease/exonuclease/phosphatase family metal-dependent hydrolase
MARSMLCVVLVAMLAMVAAAPDAVSAVKIRVLQLNICHSGIADCFTGDRVLAKARSVIAETSPQLVSVNEACSGDVEALRSAMRGAARTLFVAAQHTDGRPVNCRNGQQFGNLIMVSSSLAGTAAESGRFAAQQTNDEARVWACLPGGRVTACTTHLADRHGDVALAQCRELMARAADYATRGPVVVSGDLNLRYLGNPDVEQCGRPGFFRRGDGNLQHAFVTVNFTVVGDTQLDMAGTTDHPAWLLTLSL